MTMMMMMIIIIIIIILERCTDFSEESVASVTRDDNST